MENEINESGIENNTPPPKIEKISLKEIMNENKKMEEEQIQKQKEEFDQKIDNWLERFANLSEEEQDALLTYLEKKNNI